jgi:hypothetical protein
VLAAAALVLALAGCGETEGADTGSGGGGDTTAAPATSLTISVLPNGTEATPMEWTLECDPAGGSHPQPDAACAALAAHPEALEPVPKATACTMIFGGPQRATITGTLDGEDVNAEFNRGGGCEIERWDALAPVFATVG